MPYRKNQSIHPTIFAIVGNEYYVESNYEGIQHQFCG